MPHNQVLSFAIYATMILMVGLFTAAFQQTPTVSAAIVVQDPCHLYDSSVPVPNPFGTAYNLFSSTQEQLLSAGCSSDTMVEVIAGNGEPNTYVYNKGYYLYGSTWREFTLNCTDGNLLVNAWCVGSAETSIPAAPTADGRGYFVGYTCQWIDNAWKCGCQDSSCTTPQWQLQAYNAATPPVLGVGEKAWQPGHYVAGGLQQSVENAAINRVKNNPDSWKGVSLFRLWRDVEEVEGVYDWSSVWNVVNELKPLGKYVTVFLKEKTFDNSNPAPAYMTGNPLYAGPSPGDYVDGYFRPPDKPSVAYAAVWNPNVYARYVALFQSFADEFKNEPYVIMVKTTETSYRPTLFDNSDVTPEIMSTTMDNFITDASNALADTQIILNFGANWEGAFTNDWIETRLCPLLEQTGSMGGGPDSPPFQLTRAQRVCYIPNNNGYGNANNFGIGMQVQPPNYNLDGGAVSGTGTAEETFFHVTQELDSNYVFWREYSGTSFTILDIQNIIGGDPEKGIETIKPLNIQ